MILFIQLYLIDLYLLNNIRQSNKSNGDINQNLPYNKSYLMNNKSNQDLFVDKND